MRRFRCFMARSPATAVAVTALILALVGGAYAGATTSQSTSVTLQRAAAHQRMDALRQH